MDMTKTSNTTKDRILNITIMGLMTAFMCVISPFAIQLPGQVPISLSMAAIYLIVYLIGGSRGTACCALYLLIGFVGIPVFSGFGSGAGKLIGPTGGYLIGYIFTAAICGAALRVGRGMLWVYIIGMALGCATAYLFGSVWFMYSMEASFGYTMTVCVYPFIPFDIAKIAAVAVVGPILKRLLCRIDGLDGIIAYRRTQKPKSA